MKDIPGDTSFLEMLDILNEQLISEGKEPVVFDHDCRCLLYTSYILQTPLFRVRNKKKTSYCYTEDERVKAIE